MSNTKNVRAYSGKEEVLHALIHGIGIALSIAGLVILVCLSCLYGNVWSIVSSAIFGTTLVLMYTASTIYHSVCSVKKKKCFKSLVHRALSRNGMADFMCDASSVGSRS